MKNYLVIVSNNGNHEGRNRTWSLIDTFDTFEEAVNLKEEMEAEDSDMSDGLTYVRVIKESEIQELKDADNILINF